MKDFPSYTTLKYYYSNKTTSRKLEVDRDWKNKSISMCASLILTEDGCIYLHQQRGAIISPDELTEERRIVPREWATPETIRYALEYQPFDFEDTWCFGHAMYSKELWRLALEDIRDFKIKIIDKEIDISDSEWNWISY